MEVEEGSTKQIAQADVPWAFKGGLGQIKSVFRITGLEILGRVGTYRKYRKKENNLWKTLTNYLRVNQAHGTLQQFLQLCKMGLLYSHVYKLLRISRM